MDLLATDTIPEEALDIKAEARAFATDHIAPRAESQFRSGDYPWDIIAAAREADLIAPDIPEKYGGRGCSLAQVFALAEEFFRADAGIALTLQLAGFGTELLAEYGTDEQCERWLTPIATGVAISGLAVSEPETGSDLAGMETVASRDGDEYVLDGEKYWIGNGVEADWLTVYAKTGSDETNRYGNHSLFVVPTDIDGFHAEHIPEKMAMRASKQAHITFENCRIPAENLIGTEGAGFYMLAEFFNHGRIIVSGHGIGLAAAAIESTHEFVHEREQFGRTLAEFQVIQHGLAEMRMTFEAARSLAWRAADRVASGENPGLWAALAKTVATEAAVDCAERGMEFHGGRSVLSDRRIARVYRDVRIPVVYEGANDIQRNLIYRQWNG